MKKRILLVAAVMLCVLAVAFGQGHFRRRAAEVSINENGAIAIKAQAGQGIAVTGNTAITGTLSASGLFTATAGVTLPAGANVTRDTGTASATAGAATLNKQTGTITSEAITTAAGAAYTLTLTNSVVSATSRVTGSVDNGTNTQGIPVVGLVTPGSGSVTIKVYNLHASQALNGTIKINF